MATASMAAAGTAAALYYFFSKGSDVDDERRFATASFAPRTFIEDLYFFAEGLRYLHDQTIGRWRTMDLLFGLSYLCNKERNEHPVADIACYGSVYGHGLVGKERDDALKRLDDIERVFRYCSGLRERRPIFQRRYLVEILNIPEEDILLQQLRAGVLKPSFVLTRDSEMQAVVLAIRGTHSFKDAFTSLTGAAKPHHMIDTNGVVLGYSHFGMLAAARWLKNEISENVKEAMESRPGYRLLIVGHSLGGGTAAMLTMMLRETGGIFAEATCIAVACPACMTLDLAKSCSGYVTTIVNSADVIPTICPGTADSLREEVTDSSWFAEFKDDVRATRLGRIVESSISRFGTATASATSWTTSRLSACYPRNSRTSRGTHKRKKSENTSQYKKENQDDNTVCSYAETNVCNSEEFAQGMTAYSMSFSRIASNMKKLTSFSVIKGSYSNFSFRSRPQEDKQEEMDSTDSISCTNSDSKNVVIHPDLVESSSAWCQEEYSKSINDSYSHETDLIELKERDQEELEADASSRMKAVELAIKAVEEEEAAQTNSSMVDNHVPAVIHPGQYAGGNWKRQMFPAGRILHLVPSHLIDARYAHLSHEDVAVNASETNHVNHTRQASELSTTLMLSSEEAMCSAVLRKSSGEEGPLPPLKPALGKPEPMILLDNIPQEAYGRIKL